MSKGGVTSYIDFGVLGELEVLVEYEHRQDGTPAVTRVEMLTQPPVDITDKCEDGILQVLVYDIAQEHIWENV
jgi:hypothetical protein